MTAIETNRHFQATAIGRRTAATTPLTAVTRWVYGAAQILATALQRRAARSETARRERAVRHYRRSRAPLENRCLRFDPRQDDVLARAGA
jgi:hypothetical protein